MKSERKLEVPHSLVIIVIVMLLATLLTYIVPAGSYTRIKSATGQTMVWTVPREIDKKKSTCRRNASNYVALLRISYGVRPFFMVILS